MNPRLSLLRENGRSFRFPKIYGKKTNRWSNDKTMIELGYRKISWFVSVLPIKYLLKPKAEANNWSSSYFAQPRPITVNYQQNKLDNRNTAPLKKSLTRRFTVLLLSTEEPW